MQGTLTATALLLALSLPAYAQSSAPSQSSTPAQTESRQGQGPQSEAAGSGQNESTLPIDQSRLSRDEIRRIQIELNKAGFDAKEVDGVWGPNSRSALRNYQQQKNLPGAGELNQQTLEALGVEIASGQQGTGSSATGASTGEQGSSAPAARGTPGQGQDSMRGQDGMRGQDSMQRQPSEEGKRQ